MFSLSLEHDFIQAFEVVPSAYREDGGAGPQVSNVGRHWCDFKPNCGLLFTFNSYLLNVFNRFSKFSYLQGYITLKCQIFSVDHVNPVW